MMQSTPLTNVQGLTQAEAAKRLQEYGPNTIELPAGRRIFRILTDIVAEPMFLLLTAACILYFILGQHAEGGMLLAAMVFVGAISFWQEVKSSKALQALKQLTDPKAAVVRDGVQTFVALHRLVPGDVILLEEGDKVPADAQVLQCNDLSLNESILTGEALPVEKDTSSGTNMIYQGTLVNSGRCYAQVNATGHRTALGKIGVSIASYTPPKTLLQLQIDRFLKRFALFGIIALLLIFGLNYFKSHQLVSSLLFGLTLAMSVLPEEIPVAFSSFMALGAYYMSRLGIISRQPQIIENLGAVTVVCLDKTGTITENKMQVDYVFNYKDDTHVQVDAFKTAKPEVLYYALLASEKDPFDAMERAIHDAYALFANPAGLPQIFHEYPLSGKPPMMTHVYQQEDHYLAASKGGVERILKICRLDATTQERIMGFTKSAAAKGHRVIAVASAVHKDASMPADQDAFHWQFKGLLSLYDPPRKNIKKVLGDLYAAGITIKLVTGDFLETARSIADETGLKNNSEGLTGDDVLAMPEAQLQEKVKTINLFARMFPDAKLKVIDALKNIGAVVAMTGDGVNDGPALKSAQIGIAMGGRGTEIARQSADLILTDDNLEKVVEAIRQGRKIFFNFKKAVRYILSIHIPIVLTASLPVVLGWRYPNIFTPIHIIFLELIMGPTCSVFFEREPADPNSMRVPPRRQKEGLFQKDEMATSIIQGLVITAGVLLLFYHYMNTHQSLEKTRTVVFTTLICSNIFLTFVNRSFTDTLFKTIRYKNNLVVPVLVISIVFLGVILLVPFARQLFQLAILTSTDFVRCIATAFVCVLWFEVYKALFKKPIGTRTT